MLRFDALLSPTLSLGLVSDRTAKTITMMMTINVTFRRRRRRREQRNRLIV